MADDIIDARKKRMRKYSFGLWVAVLLFQGILAGCATTYEVTTNAYLDKSLANLQIPTNASLAVLPNSNVPNTIFDNEVKTKIEALLVKKGYRVVPFDQSNYAVKFSYDITGKQKTTTRSQVVTGPPIIQKVYVSSTQSYVTTVMQGYDYLTYVPETYTVYLARLFIKVLDAKNLKEFKEDKVIWVGDTMNESMDPDLRRSIDYLLVGTFKFFGQDTGKNQEINLPQDDPEVTALRGPEKNLQGFPDKPRQPKSG